MFFGIIIRIYFTPKEHNSPPIHTYFQENKASFSILKGEMLEGSIPQRQQRMIQAWIEIHRDELLADWALCQNGEKPFNIQPLK